MAVHSCQSLEGTGNVVNVRCIGDLFSPSSFRDGLTIPLQLAEQILVQCVTKASGFGARVNLHCLEALIQASKNPV